MELINKAALVAEIKRRKELVSDPILLGNDLMIGERNAYFNLLLFIDTLEVKEIDIDKLCEFRKNIGFAYPEGASEYQKHLACYRQGIEDVLKAQKGE